MTDDKLPAQPGYWAILPAGIRYDDRIPANAKLLYAEISSLTGKTGYCFAPDSYFAGIYQITERSVRRLLAALEKEGYIRIEREAGEHNATVERRIFAGINPLAEAPSSLDKKVQTGVPVRTKKSGSSDKKVQTHL
ncbi:MAG: helix-turn-helix domain-containing protein, partial [Oscillospiraceae bacterium]|nr:helix-turn-helix domain-containing protein [Oscillospiraceae bacterium]